MTLKEAIEIGEYIDKAETIMWMPHHYKALKLLIEAGKRDVHNRLINNHPDQAKLPGETEE